MTAKRFMLDDCGELIDLNNHKFINYGEECCNLLNEQHETIQRLQEENKELEKLRYYIFKRMSQIYEDKK
jgi:hypothetical protein